MTSKVSQKFTMLFCIAYIVPVFLLLAFNIIMFLPVLFNNDALLSFSNNFFMPACNNHPDRSFIINMVIMPVCARCMGVYNGMLFAAFFYYIYLLRFPMIKSKKYLLFLLFPFIIQLMLKIIGIDFEKFWRYLSGFLLGAVVPVIYLEAVSCFKQFGVIKKGENL